MSQNIPQYNALEMERPVDNFLTTIEGVKNRIRTFDYSKIKFIPSDNVIHEEVTLIMGFNELTLKLLDRLTEITIKSPSQIPEDVFKTIMRKGRLDSTLKDFYAEGGPDQENQLQINKELLSFCTDISMQYLSNNYSELNLPNEVLQRINIHLNEAFLKRDMKMMGRAEIFTIQTILAIKDSGIDSSEIDYDALFSSLTTDYYMHIKTFVYETLYSSAEDLYANILAAIPMIMMGTYRFTPLYQHAVDAD